MIYFLGNFFNSGMSGSVIFAIVVAYIIAIVLAFGMHEFSHAFSAYKLGDPTAKALGRLTLNPIKHLDLYGMLGFLFVGFGWAKPVPINPLNFRRYRRDTFIVSVSGVLTNLILAFVFSGAYFFFYVNCAKFVGGVLTYSNALLYFVHYFFQFMVIINLGLFIFNLLPIFPLDGFNAVKACCKRRNKFIDFMHSYGNLILLFIIITPIFDVVYRAVTGYFTEIFFNFWGLFA